MTARLRSGATRRGEIPVDAQVAEDAAPLGRAVEHETAVSIAKASSSGVIRATSDAYTMLRSPDRSRHAYVGPVQSRACGTSSALAGLGNVYADEVLFHARVHPRRPTDAFDDRALGRLHRTTRRVLQRAIERNADPAAVPHTWLLPHREAGAPCPRWGTPLERVSVGGRSTYFCPRCQT